MIRVLPAPIERLASTNSFSLSESVFPRTTRATYGHEKRTITAMTIERPGLINPPAQPSFVVRARRDDADRDQKLRNGEHDIRPTRKRRVRPAAEEAGHEADERADQYREA